MTRHVILLAISSAALAFGACASMPQASKSPVVTTDDTILFTLAKGEALYTDEEIMAISFDRGARDEAKLKRRLKDAANYPFGSKRNPVRVDMPEGQRAYLSRLRCSGDTSIPEFSRAGNFGAGPYETIIDGYEVTCPGKDPVMIYMDMYFPGNVENRAPAGFRIMSRMRDIGVN